mgnify:CR=1 FL=1
MSTMKSVDTIDTSAIKNRRWGRPLLGMLISVICLSLIVRKVDLHSLAHALSQFQWPYLVNGLLLLASGYCFRILRWTLMLQAAGSKVKVKTCAAPFLGSIALNNILPLRIGDLVRAFVFPDAIGVHKSLATSSLVMERLIDLVTLFAFLMFGFVMIKETQIPDWLVKSATSLVSLSGLCLILVFLYSGKLAGYFTRVSTPKIVGSTAHFREKSALILADLLGGFEAMSRLRVLLTVFALSILVWLSETGLFWCLLSGFKLESSLALGMLVMAIVTFSTLIPSSPGYIGPFHLAAFTAISMLGGTSEQAASFAVLSHLSLWIPTTLAGGIAIVLKPELFRSVIAKSNNKELKHNY